MSKKKLKNVYATTDGLTFPPFDTSQQIYDVTLRELFRLAHENEIEKNNANKSTKTFDTAAKAIWERIPNSTKEKTSRQITQMDISATRSALLNATNQKTGEPLAPKSIETYMRYFKIIVDFAVKNKYLYSGITVKPYKAPEQEKEMYTNEELSRLLEQPQTFNDFCEHRNWMIVCFTLETGAREKSLIHIKLKDVHLDEGYVDIKVAKGNKPYVAGMGEKVARLIGFYVQIRMAQGATQEDYLFCTQCGEQFSEWGLYRAVEKHCKLRGVRNRGLHQLRHECATALAKNGATADEIRLQLNHSDIRTSEGYIHATRRIKKSAFESISPLANIG